MKARVVSAGVLLQSGGGHVVLGRSYKHSRCTYHTTTFPGGWCMVFLDWLGLGSTIVAHSVSGWTGIRLVLIWHEQAEWQQRWENEAQVATYGKEQQ